MALCGEGARSDPETGRCVCKVGQRGEDCGQGNRHTLTHTVDSCSTMSVICNNPSSHVLLTVYGVDVCVRAGACVCLCLCVFLRLCPGLVWGGLWPAL